MIKSRWPLGDSRSRGSSVRDVIARDRMSVPIPLRLQSPIFLGDEDIPSTGTPHRGFARAEAERLWRLACRAHLRRPGRHYLLLRRRPVGCGCP
jgi:hypothetical protein